MMSSFIKINDSSVNAVTIQDNGEQLVELSKKYPDIFIDQSRKYSQSLSPSISLVRLSIAEKLQKVQFFLPNGIKLMIIEGYRPLSVQKVLFENYKLKIRLKNPNLSNNELSELTSTFVAPPKNTPPHSTGGALDLTLIDSNKEELDLGGGLSGDYSEKCFTNNSKISDQAGHNRKILIEAMNSQSFVNYPAEWWHWSHGDRYWALIRNESHAFYGGLNL